MTDARLPGYWLTEMRFSDLTDKQWRVFTGLLMWSNEQATDGHVPTRYIRAAHPDGVDDSDIDALVACDVLERTDTGLQMLRWEDPRGLRQSTAAQVEKFRQSRREIQAAYRKRQKEKTVTGHVGEGNKRSGSSSSAYGMGNETSHVTGNARRPASWTTAPAQTMQTVQPGSDCGPGNHLIAGGVCSLCEARDF